jgi:hypothetical protein
VKAQWQAVIESRPDYDYPSYPLWRWKRDVFEGRTRLGYAEIVAELLAAPPAPLPDVLKQFKPRSNVGKSVQRATVAEFNSNGAVIVASPNGHGWFAMRHAFENLIPFIVANGEDSFIVAKDTEENRSDLSDLGSKIVFEWDGYAMLDFMSM